jgi:nicotinamide mononucleotide transporter
MDWLDHPLTAFFNAKWQVTADQAIYNREIVGNAFGLAWTLFGCLEHETSAALAQQG